MLPHIPQAIICGCMGGIFSPFCFLSLLLSGGMAVSIKISPTEPPLTLKETLMVGSLCGLIAGSSAFFFWYIAIIKLQSGFEWFFSSVPGKDLVQVTSSLLWQYGLVHFFLSVPLCICGALISHIMQKQ